MNHRHRTSKEQHRHTLWLKICFCIWSFFIWIFWLVLCQEAFQFDFLSFSKLIFLLYYQRIFRTFHFEKRNQKEKWTKRGTIWNLQKSRMAKLNYYRWLNLSVFVLCCALLLIFALGICHVAWVREKKHSSPTHFRSPVYVVKCIKLRVVL